MNCTAYTGIKRMQLSNFWWGSVFDESTELIFTCSKSTIETLDKGAKYVQG